MRRKITLPGAGVGMALILAAVAYGGSGTLVEPGRDTLLAAVYFANPGDTLYLAPGVYEVSESVEIAKDLTIKGSSSNPEDVHIVPIDEREFDVSKGGHVLLALGPGSGGAPGAKRVYFANFTVKRARDFYPTPADCPGLNPTECNGNGIHADGVESVRVKNVHAILNGGNGIFIDGATSAYLKQIVGVSNRAFGIDVDSALKLTIRDSTFIANGISGLEAAGHIFGTEKADYYADVYIESTLAMANGEIGIEVERFENAKVRGVTCSNNREDGFDADRVINVDIADSAFINNLNDGLELFPIDVPAYEQPANFPGSIVEKYENLRIFGNLAKAINHPPTEN